MHCIYVIFLLFHAAHIAHASNVNNAGNTSYSNYWPDLETQCTSAYHVFISLNVTLQSFDPKLCCFNATLENPIGHFPLNGMESQGSFIGCALDNAGRPYVSALQVNKTETCIASTWPSFAGLPLLNTIMITNCNMQGVVVDWNALSLQTPSLSTLIIHSNGLSGSISEHVSSLSLLNILDFSKNNLNGLLPWSIGSLVQLAYLDVSDNYLSGSIPDSLSRLTNLKALDLTSNLFYGQLPDLSGCNDLELCALPVSTCVGVNYGPFPTACNITLKTCPTLGSPSGVSNAPVLPFAESTQSSGSFSRSFGVSIGIGISCAILLLSLLGCALYYLERKTASHVNNEGGPWNQLQDQV